MAEEAKTEPVIPEEPEVVVEVSESGEVKSDAAVADLASQYKALEEAAQADKAARDEALSRAARAQQEAEAARREASAARAAAASSNLDTINTALASAQAEIDAAKRDVKLAGEQGDFIAQADAYERMAKATTLAARYDEAKADLESRARYAEQPRQRQPDHPDPVEAYVRGRTEQTAEWLRAHKEFILDPTKNHKLTSAHYSALSQNLRPDTPEYFNHVEVSLGLKEGAKKVVDNTGKPEERKSQQRPVAPVTPTTGGSGRSGNEVRLSAGEARAATDGTHVWNYDDPSPQKRWKRGDPIGIQEFARRKMAMEKSGLYDKTNLTQ